MKTTVKTGKTILKWLMILAGMFCVALGVIGIFLPVLPTTPFLLLAAFLFARSSDKFYVWLMNNKMFGGYIRNYLKKKTIALRVKITAISILWISIGAATIFFIKILTVRILLVLIAIIITTHIVSLKTR